MNCIIAAVDACPLVLPSDVDELTRLISDLGNRRFNLEFFFESATAFVVLGVAVEVAIVWIEFRKARKEYREDLVLWERGENGPPHKPIRWHVVVELAAAAAVAVGVLGEFWVEKEIGDVNTCIQQVDSVRATTLEKEVATATAQNVSLAQQILELGPRDDILYGLREEIFINGIRPFKGQKVQVRICELNNETRPTAERIVAVFKLAEWNVSPHSPDWGENNCLVDAVPWRKPTGIWVGMPNPIPDAVTRARAEKLIELFNAKPLPLSAQLHMVRPDTARLGPNHTTIQGMYDAPDSIVVTVLAHPLEEKYPPASAPVGVITLN